MNREAKIAMLEVTCPFCGKQMEAGILSGDGRSPVTWKQGNKKAGLMDIISGAGTVTAAKRTLTAFTIETRYCPDCRRMIFETDVTK